MSMITSSLAPISRSEASWWGSAAFSPAATIVGKAGPVAPSSRIRCSAPSWTSRSVRPTSPRPQIHSYTASASCGGGRDPLHLRGVLLAPEPPEQALHRDELDALADRVGELSQRAHAGARLVVAHTPAQALRELGQRLALGLDALERGVDLALRPLDVAEVGEEQPLARAHNAQRARPGEAREPEDVGLRLAPRIAGIDEVGDDELVEARGGDGLAEAVGMAGGQVSSSALSNSRASR